MAWRRRDRNPGPAPAWVDYDTGFAEADWIDDEADAAWLGSADPDSEWAAGVRAWHRQARWHAARSAWFDAHPAHADAEVARFIAGIENGP